MSRSTVLIAAMVAMVSGCGNASKQGSEGVTRMSVSEQAKGPGDSPAPVRVYASEAGKVIELAPMVLTDAEWKARLTAEQYQVLRRAGTEAAFTGKYWDHHADGRYSCAGCGIDLFTSNTKFDSGCGWPSFYAPVDTLNVVFRPDRSHGMERTEVLCRRCGAHLGHVFDDGPAPTGQRYCMNSAALGFTGDAADTVGGAVGGDSAGTGR